MDDRNACDVALARAIATDKDAARLAKEMMQAQDQFDGRILEEMYGASHDSHIHAPGKAEDGYWEAFEKQMGMSKDKPAKIKLSENAWHAWNKVKQSRVASMLSNPLTHLKNFSATGVHAVTVRPLEEAMAIAISRMNGQEARSFKEMVAYGNGMKRAAHDFIGVAQSLGKIAGRQGAVKGAEVGQALKEAGYSAELAHGKVDIVLDESSVYGVNWADTPAHKEGLKYLVNGIMGSQFSALQAVDTAFKMISHRAKVQQLLFREGFKKGLNGEVLDDFVTQNWDEMADRVKSGRDMDHEVEGFSSRLGDYERTGIAQAAEDTFTETPQTQLGKFVAGKFDTSVGWKKTVSESMQVLAPFRSIYVNLMRQTFSRRLMPFFDKKTMGELSGAKGQEVQQLARARVAAAYTLFSGTAAVIGMAGIKVHGADDIDPTVRKMQFDMYGKVGNTLQIGDFYFPIDGLPPSIAIPLGYTAIAAESMDEFNYRYHDPEDREKVFMKAFSPLVSAVTEGPWVKEYLDFLGKLSGYTQTGNVPGLAEYLTSVTVSPYKMPNWINNMMPGNDPYLKTTEGAIGRFRTDLLRDVNAYGHKRNLFGRKIMPFERFGEQAEDPWYMGEKDVTDFLKVANYDKVYGRNVTRIIYGDSNSDKGYNAVKPGDDDVDMTPKMRDRFEYYVGQSRFGSGKTLEEEFREYMHRPGVYDEKRGVLIASEAQVQAGLRGIMTRRRKNAKTLMKYHPEFGVRKEQIERFYSSSIANGHDPAKAARLRDMKIQAMNQAQMQLKRYF